MVSMIFNIWYITERKHTSVFRIIIIIILSYTYDTNSLKLILIQYVFLIASWNLFKILIFKYFCIGHLGFIRILFTVVHLFHKQFFSRHQILDTIDNIYYDTWFYKFNSEVTFKNAKHNTRISYKSSIIYLFSWEYVCLWISFNFSSKYICQNEYFEMYKPQECKLSWC